VSKVTKNDRPLLKEERSSKCRHVSEISGSHGSEYEDERILGIVSLKQTDVSEARNVSVSLYEI
jgi:hypothetical protein